MNAYANQHRTEYEMKDGKCIRVWDCIWYAGIGDGYTKRVAVIADGIYAQSIYDAQMLEYESSC